MKNRTVKFRCSESEKERIEGLAQRAGMNLSEYCRQMCLTGRILATPKLTPEEVSYFRALKDHRNGLARISNLIRMRSPELVVVIREYLDKSQELQSRFF
ncbi:hypothetical protein [uncultured Alistipes sp.]|jgi:ribbon-helix-helix protein, copG family|uniref:plasmid mobilization protein n=1 Tax=uncultured Alistipes sp. TaxID=538949 RepID=UPI0025FB4E78|nr:hypothetical protein [uncultured Alistipes sp.]